MIARKIDSSPISEAPPYTREIWFYLIRTVNHSDSKQCKRGQTIRRYLDIREALKWYVGYRKCMYTIAQCENAMKLLVKANMIAKKRTTRGLLITICNYDTYQNPKSYESQSYSPQPSATMEPQPCHTINKKKKNEKKEKKQGDFIFPDNLNTDEFKRTWKDWIQHRKEKRQPLTPTTIKRQIKMLSENSGTAVATLEQSMEKGWQGLFVIEGKTKTDKPKVCFVCGDLATIPIPTGSGIKRLCDNCKNLLDKAPDFRNHKSRKVVPKSILPPSQLENMILKQKAGER